MTLTALPWYRYKAVNAKTSKGTCEDPKLTKTTLIYQALKRRHGTTNSYFRLGPQSWLEMPENTQMCAVNRNTSLVSASVPCLRAVGMALGSLLPTARGGARAVPHGAVSGAPGPCGARPCSGVPGQAFAPRGSAVAEPLPAAERGE